MIKEVVFSRSKVVRRSIPGLVEFECLFDAESTVSEGNESLKTFVDWYLVLQSIVLVCLIC